ncbi:DUF421 domain-containing protein [Sporosarcina sp. Marseille-Q4063]|uniref:DUF421 domain-containing protein n=1 Tax=Sporosarcina sp. Marseille-Q4063 TaxID=2810514 RepID=UPI001BAEAA6C|nr:YetF domain-containing protein [Sporosarcina sp. Marseille-Q4063]QUW22532.1 DUF421 domain-containing protein [Sporosarcina sp. Marseille-Q4063]
MDFFHSQESLTTIQWIIRAIISYVFLLFATKLMGRRSISQLRLIDFTIALILGNILAHPLSDEKLGMKGSLVTTTTLVVLYTISVLVSLRWTFFKKWIEPSPFPLIRDGKIQYKGLKKARITIEHLLSEVRKEKIEEVRNVALALWEPDGTISFFMFPQLQSLTAEDMQIIKKPFIFHTTIILEGKVDMNVLHSHSKDTAWLEKKIEILNVEIPAVLLATIDNNDNLTVYTYD